MERTVDTYLKKWARNNKRKPLIIRGARQVGKTYSVDKLGLSFKHYVKVDFEETPSLTSLFDGDFDVKKITAEICALKGLPYVSESTLLFFDEIQECPNAIRSLRYYYERLPEISVIAAGSLLEFSIINSSFPVGRVSFYWMYPMTFQEFLIANGMKSLLSYIPRLDASDPVPTSLHSKLLEILKEYYIIGGMPEAVKTFMENSSYTKVAEIHRSIIFSYIEDITKHYPKTDKQLITQIFYNAARHVGKQIKYSKLAIGERSDKIKSVLEKFYKILVFHPIYASNGEFPFKTAAHMKLFKLIFLDIGLMQNMCGIRLEKSLLNVDLMAIYEGALAEQFIGQELIASQTTNSPELYYWTRQQQGGEAEIDFLIENNPIIPVEVKSDKAGRLRSMHQALLQFKHIPYGVVLSTRNVEVLEEQRLKFLPLYCVLRL